MKVDKDNDSGKAGCSFPPYVIICRGFNVQSMTAAGRKYLEAHVAGRDYRSEVNFGNRSASDNEKQSSSRV